MAEQEGLMTPPLVENILAQAEALRSVASHQFDAGREALFKAAEMMRSSKRILLTGMGASLYASIPLSYFLASRRVAAVAMESSELLHFATSTVDSDTAVVIVSRSGESVEVTKLLPVLLGRGCRVVGVTNTADSTLASQASATVLLNCPADQMVAIQTYTATLVTLLLLGAAYFDDPAEGVRSELETTIETMSRWVPECYSWSGSWPGFLGSACPLYLLGRGPSLAAVQEGVLLMHEVAKMPATGMSVPQFRHGPVEVVDEEFYAVIFGSQKATAELDLSLAQDLVKMNGNVRWVGPLDESSSIAPLYPWPAEVPDRFIPVLEVVPMQIAAYQAARWRGVPAGEFRFAPQVTLSERGFAASNAT